MQERQLTGRLGRREHNYDIILQVAPVKMWPTEGQKKDPPFWSEKAQSVWLDIRSEKELGMSRAALQD